MGGVISFVFSSPRHHAEILLPVVRELEASGHRCQVISIAEFRGLKTPSWDVNGAPVKRLMPFPRPMRIPAPTAGEGGGSGVRGTAQRLLWKIGIGPRLRWLLRGSDVVVIPNDAAFPYRELVSSLRGRRIPFVLVQEGIRFTLPTDIGIPYGSGGADRVCVWGQGSAEHFAAVGVPASRLRITGNPRFDGLDIEAWRKQASTVLTELGLATPPLLFLSNPIETMGLGTRETKLEMFAGFLREVRPVLLRHRLPLVVKLHPFENPDDFARVADTIGVELTIAKDTPLFGVLASAKAAVVTASTVGLEALVFGLPLGVLEIPNHGFAFEYVQRGAAIGLTRGTIEAGVERILAGDNEQEIRAREFVDRHLANRGSAFRSVGDAITSVTP